MEEKIGNQITHQHLGWQWPKLNYSKDPQELGQLNSIASGTNLHANLMSKDQTSPLNAFSDPPHLQAGQANEPHGWFYCLPRFRQAFAPAPSPDIKSKPSSGLQQNLKQVAAPNVGLEYDQKRYFVFDQSGNQTTLIYNSLLGNSVQHQPLVSWNSKCLAAYNSSRREDQGTRTPDIHSGPILTDEFNKSHSADVEDELHEDTEELNALLYSDDDSYDSEDDEETSTGHSPSTMTVHDDKEWLDDGSTEDVASSSNVVMKKRKLSHGGFSAPSLMDTATSIKPTKCIESSDDAESSCADSTSQWLGESGPLSGNKRMRKDKIRETVSILQSIIPGGKGKDAVDILDEAIHYLKSLKHKAVASGLKSL